MHTKGGGQGGAYAPLLNASSHGVTEGYEMTHSSCIHEDQGRGQGQGQVMYVSNGSGQQPHYAIVNQDHAFVARPVNHQVSYV